MKIGLCIHTGLMETISDDQIIIEGNPTGDWLQGTCVAKATA